MSNKKKAADYFKEVKGSDLFRPATGLAHLKQDVGSTSREEAPKASYPHSVIVGREQLSEPEQLEYSSVPVRGMQEQYADQSRMQQLQTGIPALATPEINYPMGPTIEINQGYGVEEPQNGGPDQGGYANKVRLPENPNAWAGAPGGTVVRDSFGNAVLSGTGQPIGLPTQNPNYKAPAGGGKGADANVDSAIKQIGGK